MEDSTNATLKLRELPEGPPTLAENPSGSRGSSAAGSSPARDPEATLRYGAPDGDLTPEAERSSSGFLSLGKGKLFRDWTILEQLPTRGAEADIYLAEAGRERCVLKLYRHRIEPQIEVLNRVAEISRTYSRCFVVFRDVGFDDDTGRWYELQEYIPMGSLQDISAEAKRGRDFVKKLVSELAEAIRCLHLNEIIHCDIKPANVLVRSLEPLDLILTDFGIASILAADASQKMTALKGTPMYWAPEAFSRAIGRPCDWWGLGMIVLELLAGEHPLEGLTDAQIIRKLTVDNVEVPDFRDPDGAGWASLVKGLLTKDDSRRWGYEEVVRWLSGRRDIPVCYEEPIAPPRAAPARIPFHFEGKNYATPEDLAHVFAVRQNPWFSGLNVLRQLRQWFESNMMFDEAMELGNEIADADSEMALFRFVHGNAQCPFSLMGKRVDVDNLRLFLENALGRQAWSAEMRIVDMLGNGRLLSFYDEYVRLSGLRRGASFDEDPLLRPLLLLMNKKTPEEQWEHFEALQTPEAFLWPRELRFSQSLSLPTEPSQAKTEILETLKEMKTAPLKRAAFEELEKNYILPHALSALFRSASTYALGVERLELWRGRDLLIPRHFAPDSSMYENLGLDEYAQAARAHWLGQTSALLEKLDFLIDSIPALPQANELETNMILRAVERLAGLKERRVAPADSLFIARAVDLYAKRRDIARRRSSRFPVAAFGGGLVFCGLRYLSGNTKTSALVWGAPILLAMIGFGMWGVSIVTRTPLRRVFSSVLTGRRDEPMIQQVVYQVVIGSVAVFLALVYFGVFVSYPYPFSFLIGAIGGGMVYYGLDRRALRRNAESILEACGSYCVSAAEGKAGNL
ncbi:MAG: protein kinase [Synergistaceae bacterium]|jgi:serine/threonine protein kinase|nr:protein kinase [Synergistaceae bacterium]